MTDHPLTDEMLQELSEEPLDGLVGGNFVKEYMRTAADWQLEQVSKWLDDNVGMLLLCAEPGVGDRYLESLEDEFIQSFIETMRPQEDNQ